MADLTIREAAAILKPPVTEKQLRAIITALHWPATGHRSTGRSGRRAPTYDYRQIERLHHAIIPFVTSTQDGAYNVPA